MRSAAPPPSQSPVALTSGVGRTFSFDAVSQPSIFYGANSFYVDVPQGARKLVLQLNGTIPGVDVDLVARFDRDNEVGDNGVITDHSSEGPTGVELLEIQSTTQPPLRAGRYYLSVILYSTGMTAAGTVKATIITDNAGPPPPTSPTQLVSGVEGRFSLPSVSSPTLYNGNRSFTIDVPEGATKLTVQIAPSVPSIDVDLYVRRGSDPVVSDGAVVADYLSESVTGRESIEISSSSSPRLQAGRYYISLGLYSTGVSASGTITARIDRAAEPPSTSTPQPLPLNTPASFSLPAVIGSTLFSGGYAYRVNVPSANGRLELTLRSDPSSVDVDLLARHGSEPQLVDGRIVADHRATSELGDETLTISSASSPALQAGAYFIEFGVYTRDRGVQSTITARFVSASGASSEAEVIKVSGMDSGQSAVRPKQGWGVVQSIPELSKYDTAPVEEPKGVIEKKKYVQ